MINHIAIYALYPNVVTIRDITAYDKDNNVVQYDVEAVEAWVDPNQYKQQRAVEYPPMSDFADAMYWASKGDNTKLDTYYAACEAVKTKYPKS